MFLFLEMIVLLGTRKVLYCEKNIVLFGRYILSRQIKHMNSLISNFPAEKDT